MKQQIKMVKNHHTADIVVNTSEIGLGLLEATSPIGRLIGIQSLKNNQTNLLISFFILSFQHFQKTLTTHRMLGVLILKKSI